jgi:NTE family protein
MDYCHTSKYTLVLQGGGALGAFQAGAFETLSHQVGHPHWVAGTSIGAINAAIIAGNVKQQRVEKLKEFWHRVTTDLLFPIHCWSHDWNRWLRQMSFLQGAVVGVPDFFAPRYPPAEFAQPGSPEALSYYDTAALKKTLLQLVDFDLINARRSKHATRLSVGAVDVESGELSYFDSQNMATADRFSPEHIMASAALPPAFAPIKIGNRYYWDGGIVSNNPLQYVLDHADAASQSFIVEIDLFNAAGEFPSTVAQVKERVKDIQFSSQARDGHQLTVTQRKLARATQRFAKKLPPALQADTDWQALKQSSEPASVAVMLFVYPGNPAESEHKDAEFSRQSMQMHWHEGQQAIVYGLQKRAWRQWRHSSRAGVSVYDLSRKATSTQKPH